MLIYIKCSPHTFTGICQLFQNSPSQEARSRLFLSYLKSIQHLLLWVLSGRSYSTLSLIPLWLVWVLHLVYKLLRIQVGEPTGKVGRKQDGGFFFLSGDPLMLHLWKEQTWLGICLLGLWTPGLPKMYTYAFPRVILE